MDKWCKENFSKEDYEAVFPRGKARKAKEEVVPVATVVPATSVDEPVPPIRALAVATSLLTSRPMWRVKLKCTGFKDPKRPLLAVCGGGKPKMILPTGVTLAATPVTKSKKRKLATVDTETKSVMAEGVPHKEAPISYAQMVPSRRRKNVTEMIARTARELEVQLGKQQDERTAAIKRSQAELQKVVDDDSKHESFTTTAMWRWVEAAGFFRPITATEVRNTLQELPIGHTILSRGANERILLSNQNAELSASRLPEGGNCNSLFDRVQSLLVDEDSSEEDDESDNDSDLMYSEDEHDLTAVAGPTRLDLADLSVEERMYVTAKSIGLIESVGVLTPRRRISHEGRLLDNVSQHARAAPNSNDKSEQSSTNDDLLRVVRAMTADLVELDSLNSKRAMFLDSATRSQQLSSADARRRSDEEAGLLSKYQLLIKKNKEIRVKNPKPKPTKNDVNALPW
jgi:hypothetical protein